MENNQSRTLVCFLTLFCLLSLSGGLVMGQTLDEATVLELGRSGDRSHVPRLRELLKRAKQLDTGPPADWAQMALAKLGERDQQQAIVCEFLNAERTYEVATVKLPYVGGAFAAQAARTLFRLDDWFEKRYYKDRYRDDPVLGYPSFWAWNVLADLYPGGPTAKMESPDIWDRKAIRRRNAAWTKWLEQHSPSGVGAPEGQGIDYTGKNCR